MTLSHDNFFEILSWFLTKTIYKDRITSFPKVSNDILGLLSNSVKVLSLINGLILCHTIDKKTSETFYLQPSYKILVVYSYP
ncbi:hypothetical protein CR513_33796, partial [Mucuna pruriens]